MVWGSNVVEDIFSLPLNTLAAFFHIITSDIHRKKFSKIFGVTDIVSVVTATNHAGRDCKYPRLNVLAVGANVMLFYN